MRNVLVWMNLLFWTVACDPPIDKKLTLVNGSNQPILVFYNVEETNHSVNGLSDYNPFAEIQRADTTRGYQRRLLADDPSYIVPGGNVNAHLGPGSWESHIGDGKLWVYVFDPETVLTNDWNSLRIGKKWTRVYALTLDQVRARSWVVSL